MILQFHLKYLQRTVDYFLYLMTSSNSFNVLICVVNFGPSISFDILWIGKNLDNNHIFNHTLSGFIRYLICKNCNCLVPFLIFFKFSNSFNFSKKSNHCALFHIKFFKMGKIPKNQKIRQVVQISSKNYLILQFSYFNPQF